MARFRVVYCGAINPPLDILMPVLEPLDVELVHANPRSGEETVAAAADADAIILHGACRCPPRFCSNYPAAASSRRTGVGVDRIDLEAAARQNLYITNAAGSSHRGRRDRQSA